MAYATSVQAPGVAEPQTQTAIDAMIRGYHNRNAELNDLLCRIDSFLSRVTGEGQPPDAQKPTPVPNGYLDQIRECVEEHNSLIDRLRSQLQRLEQIA